MTATVSLRTWWLVSLGASLLAGLCIALEIWLLLGMIGGVFMACALALWAPTVPFWIWLLSGPTVAGLFAVGGSGGGLAISADRAAIALLAGVMALRLLRRPQEFLAPGCQEWLLAAFLGVAFLTMIATGGSIGYPEGSRKRDLIFLAMGYGFPALGFFFAKNIITDVTAVRRLLLVVLVVGVYAAFTGIVGFVLGVDWFLGNRYETVHPDRAHGPFPNSVEFGMIVNAGLVTALLLLLRARAWPTRGVLVGLLLLFLLALFLSKTRAVWLGTMMSVGLLMLYRPVLRGPVLAGAAVAGVLGTAIVPLLVDLRVLLFRVTEMAPIYNRFTLTATALNMIASNPLFGVGFGRDTFAKHKLPHMTTVGDVPMFFAVEMGVPHNEFIHILVMCGIVGLALYLTILVRGMLISRAFLAVGGRSAPGSVADLGLVVLCLGVMFTFNGFFADLGPFTFAAIQLQVVTGALFGMIQRYGYPVQGRWKL